MIVVKNIFLIVCVMLMIGVIPMSAANNATVSGKVFSSSESAVEYATIYLKGTEYGCQTDDQGVYSMVVPEGEYTAVISALGYESIERTFNVAGHQQEDFLLASSAIALDEVVVMQSGVGRLRKSAFNAVALDAVEMHNSTKNLGDALAKAPGVKLRESGGVGSDMQLMLDGFSGKHVKIFIDGVPQEGVGSSFGLNNIPVNYAERIEVYRGVVPVGFGADALGGVVNIVTSKRKDVWFLDASYSFGSFNTHKSYINFGQTFKTGFTYEVNMFQNYSDNDYWVDAPVEDFQTGRIDKSKLERVQRFNDTYHNEAVVAKVGVAEKSWADRLMVGFTFSNMYKDIQTGVRQEIVYGEKHRKGYSLMPSLEYSKRNLAVNGLDLMVTANYNNNVTTNVDTASYKYNWRGEKKLMNSPGEQSYQHSRADNNNWNATATINYRFGAAHMLTLNHVFNAFMRNNTSLLAKEEAEDAINKQTRKNITGLSYRLMLSDAWNISVFGKYYDIYVSGPMAVDANNTAFERTTRSIGSMGYGAAGTYFILPELQAKLSYEKAYRLPTIEEMFGDEDLEMGDIGIRPEKSDNININLSYNKHIGKHGIYAEGGLIYRNTKDYIQRNIADLSGGKFAATYVNYGKVLTKGFNLTLRYNYDKWLSVGGNLTMMDVRDNMKRALGSSVDNMGYKQRMPNLPYLFADADASFYWHDLGKKGNRLIVTYDNHYLHSFSYYSSHIGANNDDYIVPAQFSHNLSLTYSINQGRYNISVECRNFTDEKLYDNFSLQKAGRAFYGKVRICFGN